MIFPANTPWWTRLKTMRTIKGITQEELAEELGTTRKQIYLWEHGRTRPNSYTRKKLSQWAGLPENNLFKGIDTRR